MRKRQGSSSILLFLLGTFSMTEIRVIGNMAIAEIPIFLCAPFLLIKNYAQLREDRFHVCVNLILFAMVGCVMSSLYNHTQFPLFLRGFATLYSILANLLMFHHLLRKNLNGARWFLIGVALSSIISIFVFQKGVDIYGRIGGQEVGESAAEAVMGGALFWVGRVGAFVLLPIRAFYLETPLVYSIVTPFIYAVFCIFVTSSGRSAALGVIGASLLIWIGGKSERKISFIGKHFLIFCVLAIFIGLFAKIGYSYLAKNGVLGEKQQEKYLHQTTQGNSVIAMLRAGRAEFFIGLNAVLEHPLVGYGPWPLDTYGFAQDYMNKYATAEDLEQYNRGLAYMASQGIYARFIPAHSSILGFWITYGLPGGIFWMYVLYLFFQLFKKFLTAIPQWYGFFVLAIPTMLWHIFFSPFGARVERTFVIACVLIARAVYQGKINIPYNMMEQIGRNNR